MKLFVLTVTIPEGYEASGAVLAEQLRRTIRQVDDLADEALLGGIVQAPDGCGRVGVLVYREVE
jgi:hypothetical protein